MRSAPLSDPAKSQPHSALSYVVIDFDTAIVNVDSQSCPSRESVSHRFCKLLFLRQRRNCRFNPGLEVRPNGSGVLLAHCLPLVSRHAADTILDIVECADAL